MLNDPFTNLYGVKIARDADGRPVASITIDERHLNGEGCAFGGCLIIVSYAAAHQTMGPNFVGSNYSFRYYHRVLVGETMEARTRIIKQGSTSAGTVTTVSVGEKIVGVMYADFYALGKYVPFDIDPAIEPIAPPEPNIAIDPIGAATPDNEGVEFEIPIQQLFTNSTKWNFARDMELHGNATFALETDERFSDATGFINPALIGMLLDDTLGSSCVLEVGTSFTTSLDMCLLKRPKPGEQLVCSGKLIMRSGSLVFSRADIFAGGVLIGSGAGTFYHMG